ncbi:MAG TPA: hypothetical protein VFR41_16195, partial [Acidimicrobiia bacterium]|nr:hypothetical protein [Acidimicrobiia bacterium]
DDRLALVDWESAEPEGLPLIDLLYFLVNAAFVCDRTLGTGRELDTYRTLLDGSSRFSRTFAATLRRHANAIDIDESCIPALRALAWMIHAMNEHDREHAHRVYLSLWRHDMMQASR